MDATAMPATTSAGEIWAALHGGDAHAAATSAAMQHHSYAPYGNGMDDDEHEHASCEEGAPALRTHYQNLQPQPPYQQQQQQHGDCGLPPSFYTTTGLPEVVPSFLLTPLPKSFGSDGSLHSNGGSGFHATGGASSSSDLFLDDILRSHDESFVSSLSIGGRGVDDLHHGQPQDRDGDGDDDDDEEQEDDAGPLRGGGAGRMTHERLSQLEDNYERKKNRAKINRKDLNSRFQELMDVLHLKEDRKLNRAKVLEKAVEQIQKLTTELQAAKAMAMAAAGAATQQQLSNGNGSMSHTTAVATHGRYQQQQQLYSVASRTPGMALPPWNNSTGMQVNMTNMTNMNLQSPPLMWMPILPHVATTMAAPSSSRLATSTTSGRKGKAKRRPTSVSSAAAVASGNHNHNQLPLAVSMASSTTQTSPERRLPHSLKRSRGSSSSPSSSSSSSPLLVWIAHQVPLLVELLDAWTLCRLMETSRELRSAATRDALWTALVQHRWKHVPVQVVAASPQSSFLLWQQLHHANQMPDYKNLNSSTSLVHFASGRGSSVGLWASLVRRSNGRTTRTVLVDGKAAVRQVVELHVAIQNNHPYATLMLTDQLQIHSSPPFRLITSDSRASHLLRPHLVTLNGSAVVSTATSASGASASGVDKVELFHGDCGVLSVFVECDGLDLEHQFLERVDGVSIQCELWTHSRTVVHTVDVSAHASVHHKHSLIAATYDPIAKPF